MGLIEINDGICVYYVASENNNLGEYPMTQKDLTVYYIKKGLQNSMISLMYNRIHTFIHI